MPIYLKNFYRGHKFCAERSKNTYNKSVHFYVIFIFYKRKNKTFHQWIKISLWKRHIFANRKWTCSFMYCAIHWNNVEWFTADMKRTNNTTLNKKLLYKKKCIRVTIYRWNKDIRRCQENWSNFNLNQYYENGPKIFK